MGQALMIKVSVATRTPGRRSRRERTRLDVHVVLFDAEVVATTEEHDQDEHARDGHGQAPAPGPGAGVGDPDAQRGARRAGPQFPHPVTRLATLPRRVTARSVAPCPLAALGRDRDRAAVR